MTTIITLTQDLRQEWLLSLTRAWPNILVALLDQAEGESLERLQLVSLELAIILGSQNLKKANLKRVNAGVENFLILESALSVDENKSVHISIKYFIRGARKYYKAPISEDLPAGFIQVSKIEASHIKEFFARCGQENSFFYDHDLAELNGHPEVIVPTQAIIAWLVNYALGIWQAESRNLSFRFNFYAAVYVHQELSLGYELDAQKLKLALYAGENLAVFLEELF